MSEINDKINAGNFSEWLRETRISLKTSDGINVPCGDCTGCCSSSYFIHIKPNETETRNHVPSALLFPAPGLPAGNSVLGYDEHGNCPLFKNGRCSIYNYRPETCRHYDCRIFTATGVEMDGNREVISKKIKNWSFSFPDELDISEFNAVKTCAGFIIENSKKFSKGFIPHNSTQLAVLAIKVYRVFMNLKPDTLCDEKTRLRIISSIEDESEKFDKE
ncbi:MAG: YkgJ family cysteine cluster protein [Spirochaetes bacterium]|nr:YkgJ family cysteine cluster protein [Spirochaetota bacterium]